MQSKFFKKLLIERAATMTETALLVALVAIVAIASIKAFSNSSGSIRGVACRVSGLLQGLDMPVFDPVSGHCVVDSGFGPATTIF